MAFGRRSTVGTAAVGPRNRGLRSMGRRKRRAATTIASNKIMGGPKTKMADMSATSGRRMSGAGAIIGDKFACLGANTKLGFYTISHPLHPLQGVAAEERNVHASERKRQKVARAVDVEMRTRAVVREKRASRLQAAL